MSGRCWDEGTHYFLSRPRRFGKSLFLDTLKELFEGSEALFEGLAIPRSMGLVGAPSGGALEFRQRELQGAGEAQASAMEQLAAIEREHGVAPEFSTAPGRLLSLLRTLHEQAGRPVAVLVDEYDSRSSMRWRFRRWPAPNRDFLRGLYAVVKDADAHIRFAFLTGVSKFSRVNLFSGLNNLVDITLDPALFLRLRLHGRDLDTVFAPELAGLDRERVRDWYNGYVMEGEEKVYNPFDILLLLRNREFDAWWFETGTPTFLVDTLFRRRVASVSLDETVGSAELLSAFDVDHIGTEALLFQTGLSHHPGVRRSLAANGYIASAIRTGRCARASTGRCSGIWCRTGRGRPRTASGCSACCGPTTWRD